MFGHVPIEASSFDILSDDSSSSIYIDRNVLQRKLLKDQFKDIIDAKNKVWHIISHGRPGELYIDGDWKDQYAIVDWVKEKSVFFQLDSESSLAVYGCNFGRGIKGRKAIDYIEKQLQISIYASDNLTGRDGDWKLEITNSISEFPDVDILYPYNLQCAAGPNERIISGRVFRDNNDNGIDDSEPGIDGVDVLIYDDVNNNGVVDAADILITTVSTSGGGNYSFTYTPTMRLYADNFSQGVFNTIFGDNNSGTDEWLNDFWIRDGDNSSFFDVARYTGGDSDRNLPGAVVQLDDADAGMFRRVNLGSATSAELSFDYDWNDSGTPSLDGDELLFIQIDPEDDGTYITLDTIVYYEAEIPATNRLISIPDSLLGGISTRIRFITDNTNTSEGEDWWIDNVNLDVTEEASNFVITTDPATYPVSFAPSTDNVEVANMPSAGSCDDDNVFGLKNCTGGCEPIAENDVIEVVQGESVRYDVLDNDSDVDGTLDLGSLSIVTAPANGTAIVDGTTGAVIYTPNGSYLGADQFVYEICDDNMPTPLCDTAIVSINIVPAFLDVCAVASIDHTYYLPYPAEFLFTSLRNASNCAGNLTNQMRSVVSIKAPYPGAIIYYDHWEDGYESNEYLPTQPTTQVWGDGDLGNGVAPGFPNDIIPAGGAIVLDETFDYNPRDPSDIFFDGKDRISTTSNIALSYIAGDRDMFTFQTAKTDVYDLDRFGTSFTVPFGENLGGVFQYTALFIRAAEDSTVVNVDLDNDGTIDDTQTIDQGEVFFIDGGVEEGAIVTSNNDIGVDVFFGGLDCFGTRQVNIFPAAYYSDVYYTPVPTTTAANPVTIYFYNSFNTPIDIDWTNNSTNGTFTVPANSSFSFQLPQTLSAYRFESQGGESYTAVSIVDNGSAYDWSFNLIAANQLTNFASIAWAPGSLDGTRNDNPVWVTPLGNTSIYIKYDGDFGDTSAAISPCGLPFDTIIAVNELDILRIYDITDNDQSGVTVFSCDGTSLAAVYGEDPSMAVGGSPSLDVGTTIQPLCIDPTILANNDIEFTLIDLPVTTAVFNNDQGFLSTVDSNSTSILIAPTNGSVTVNPDGTVTYIPDSGYFGFDSYQYQICSQENADLCDFATVFISITGCPAELDEKLLFGRVYNDFNINGIYNDEPGIGSVAIDIYNDLNQDGILDGGDTLLTREISDPFGVYLSLFEPSIDIVSEDFNPSSYSGGEGWSNNWVETGESTSPTGGEIRIINNELRFDDNGRSIYRDFDLTNYSSAILSFDYRRQDNETGENLIVEVSTDGGGSYTTIFTIFGNGGTDVTFINSGNLDLTPYVGNTVRLRFLGTGPWSSNVSFDNMFIDNIEILRRILPSNFIIDIDETTIPDGFAPTSSITQAVTVNSGGVCSEYNFGLTNPCEIGFDSDMDGLADICDLDDDNDGIPDEFENEVCQLPSIAGYDALWNFENSLNDESGNNYNPQNSPSITYNSNSVIGGSAVELDGNDVIQYSNGTFMNQAITSFSYSLWFNPVSLSGIQFLVEEGGSGNGVTIRLNNNQLQARIKEGGIREDTDDLTILDTGYWYHVVLTYDNGDMNFYLNGEPSATVTTGIGELAAHNNAGGIGGNISSNAYEISGTFGFNGMIDQVIHYPTALSAAQVESLYSICDTDGDGIANRLDLDSDNDGILDVYEAGHTVPADSDGRISNADEEVGGNGLDDRVESAPDSDIIGYTLSDSETLPDGIYDPYELDSDNDGCYDSVEESVNDSDQDGFAGFGVPITDSLGLVNAAKPYVSPTNNEWQDFNLISACDPCIDPGLIDTDGDGYNDVCDIDDDNDGIPDIIESGFNSECPTIGTEEFPEYDYTNCSIVSGGVLFSNIGVFYGTNIDMFLADVGGAQIDCGTSGTLGCVAGDNGFTINNTDPDSIMTVSFFESGTSNPVSINWAFFVDDFDDVEGLAVDSSNLLSYTLNSNNGTIISDLGGRLNFQSEDNNEDDISFYFANVQTVSFQFTHDVNDRDICFSSTSSGIPDNPTCILSKIIGRDTDDDGIDNHLDLDSDNDGILDVYEAGHNLPPDATGRIAGVNTNIGVNGLDDRLETIADSGTITYSVADSEDTPTGEYDPYELDSDGDGCFDALEEGVPDSERDGTAGTGVPIVDTDGLVDGIKPYVLPPNNEWQNSSLLSACIENCVDGIDNDGDGLVDCDDPDCDLISFNIAVGPCVDDPLQDVATLDVTISWSDAISDTLEVIADGSSQIIYTNTTTSPTTLTFNIPADGSTGNSIRATWGYYNELCSGSTTFDAPAPCSNDTIACNILFLCGDEKPSDASGWDYGWIEYLDDINGSSVVDPVYVKNEPGLGTYDPINTTIPITVNFSNYDLIVVSASTENHISADLVNVLRSLSSSIILGNYLEVQAFDLSNSAGSYSFQSNLYTDDVTTQQFYNYGNNIDPLFSNVFTRMSYRADGSGYLWTNSGNQSTRTNGVYVHYERTDIFPNIPFHGPRTFFGMHMNQIFANQKNGGPIPAPQEFWFHPAKDLTPLGKIYFDQMLIEAAAECGIDCRVATINPHILYNRR